MSNALMADLDIDGYNPDAVDKAMEAGGVVPPDKYHARLDGAKEIESKEKGTPGFELTFTLLAGDFAGQEVRDTVWITDDEKAKTRRVLFMHRLGMLDSEPVSGDPKKKRYVPVAGKHSFVDCIGTECVIDVEVEEYDQLDKTTKRPTGKKGKKNRLAWCGVWKLDDPKVKDVPRADGAAGARPMLAKAKDDLGDI